MELFPCHATLPDSVPLSSLPEKGGAALVVIYSRALSALRDVAAESGRDPRHYGLQNIEGAMALASGCDISELVIQRELTWSSDAYKQYAQNKMEDSRCVSRKLTSRSRSEMRLPGEDTIWGMKGCCTWVVVWSIPRLACS